MGEEGELSLGSKVDSNVEVLLIFKLFRRKHIIIKAVTKNRNERFANTINLIFNQGHFYKIPQLLIMYP